MQVNVAISVWQQLFERFTLYLIYIQGNVGHLGHLGKSVFHRNGCGSNNKIYTETKREYASVNFIVPLYHLCEYSSWCQVIDGNNVGCNHRWIGLPRRLEVYRESVDGETTTLDQHLHTALACVVQYVVLQVRHIMLCTFRTCLITCHYNYYHYMLRQLNVYKVPSSVVSPSPVCKMQSKKCQ